MNYWIKSNTGDWVREHNGNYELNIIERHYEIDVETIKVDRQYLKITESGQEKVPGIEVNMNINQVVKDYYQQEY
jgi:hypothetical protein